MQLPYLCTSGLDAAFWSQAAAYAVRVVHKVPCKSMQASIVLREGVQYGACGMVLLQ